MLQLLRAILIGVAFTITTFAQRVIAGLTGTSPRRSAAGPLFAVLGVLAPSTLATGMFASSPPAGTGGAIPSALIAAGYLGGALVLAWQAGRVAGDRADPRRNGCLTVALVALAGTGSAAGWAHPGPSARLIALYLAAVTAAWTASVLLTATPGARHRRRGRWSGTARWTPVAAALLVTGAVAGSLLQPAGAPAAAEPPDRSWHARR